MKVMQLTVATDGHC